MRIRWSNADSEAVAPPPMAMMICLYGVVVQSPFGIVAPKGVPKTAIDKLHAAVLVAVRQPDIREKLLGVGVEASEVSPAECARINGEKVPIWIQRKVTERARWAPRGNHTFCALRE